MCFAPFRAGFLAAGDRPVGQRWGQTHRRWGALPGGSGWAPDVVPAAGPVPGSTTLDLNLEP